jgi:NADH:ubiquinone oxidoreductase subunit 3 (subunit A)
MVAGVVGSGARIFAGTALALAGGSKLLDPRSFGSAMRQFPIARTIARTRSISYALAVFVALFEVIVGTLFIFAVSPRIVGTVIFSAMTLFTLAVIVAVVRGEKLRCGCFGASSSDVVSSKTVLRNAILMALAAVGAGFTPAAASIPGGAGRSTYFANQLLGLQAALLGALALSYALLRKRPGYSSGIRGVETEPPLGEVWSGVRGLHIIGGSTRGVRHE